MPDQMPADRYQTAEKTEIQNENEAIKLITAGLAIRQGAVNSIALSATHTSDEKRQPRDLLLQA